MKALILAGGRGSRMGDIGGDNKCLLELKDGLCALDYNIQRAVEIKPDKIIIVVGYQSNKIINKYGLRVKNIPIAYVMQQEQKGLVHAIECAKNQIGNSDFFLFLGDEVLINSRHKEMVNRFNLYYYLSVVCGVLSETDIKQISKTYTLITRNSSVIRIIEKPTHNFENMQGTGHCIFKNAVLNYIEHTPVNIRRGRTEKELPDLIQCVIDDGELVEMFDICDKYVNINEISEIKTATEML
jgi:dTDP-glucose pyrophosphorylase